MCIGLGAVMDRWLAWRGARASAAPMPAVPPIRRWIGIWLGLMAVTWGVGLGTWGWQARQDHADGQARFVAADPDGPRPAEADGYLTLSGRLCRDLALEHQVGSGSARRTEHLLVPFTATAADPSPQRPVRYVVRMQPGLSLRNAAGAPLQVHDEAPLAVPAAQAFAQAGIPVHADARIVRIVQAPAAASAASTRSARELRTLLQVCAGASVMFTLAVAVLAAAERRRAAAASR